MQANKRVSQWQHNGRFSRRTHAYPGANECVSSPRDRLGPAALPCLLNSTWPTLQAAEKATGAYAIDGADQARLAEGHILTSLMRRADRPLGQGRHGHIVVAAPPQCVKVGGKGAVLVLGGIACHRI